jgi:L-asparaginase II
MPHSPLVTAYRGGSTDAVYYGSVAVTDSTGRLLFSYEEPNYKAFLRSSVKMFQAIPVVLSGAADRFGFSNAELSICCASHTGAGYHLEAAAGILRKIGLDPSALRCGAHEPADLAERNRLIRENEAPSQLHNNCSGKHAGMLATCLMQGWPLESYLEIDHPLQVWIHDLIAEYSGVARRDLVTAMDGCSLPTCYLPIATISTMLARFIERAGRDGAERRILAAAAAHPEMIQEIGAFDSELTRVLAGRGIAKRGAMAIHVIGVDTERYGPIGITVKLEDGNSDSVPIAVMSVLWQLGILTASQLEELRRFETIHLANWRGIGVGDMKPTFMLIENG